MKPILKAQENPKEIPPRKDPGQTDPIKDPIPGSTPQK